MQSAWSSHEQNVFLVSCIGICAECADPPQELMSAAQDSDDLDLDLGSSSARCVGPFHVDITRPVRPAGKYPLRVVSWESGRGRAGKWGCEDYSSCG